MDVQSSIMTPVAAQAQPLRHHTKAVNEARADVDSASPGQIKHSPHSLQPEHK